MGWQLWYRKCFCLRKTSRLDLEHPLTPNHFLKKENLASHSLTGDIFEAWNIFTFETAKWRTWPKKNDTCPLNLPARYVCNGSWKLPEVNPPLTEHQHIVCNYISKKKSLKQIFEEQEMNSSHIYTNCDDRHINSWAKKTWVGNKIERCVG